MRLRYALLLILLACSDEPTAMMEEDLVGSVTLSRDTVWLEVGDTAGLRVDVLDKMGNLSTVAPTWSSADPAIANIVATGLTTRYEARGGGLGRAVARAGKAADTTFLQVRRPFTATNLSLHLDTIDATETSDSLGVISTGPDGDRLGHYTVVSRDTTVAAAGILQGPTVQLRLHHPGASWVVITERQGTKDSAQIVVHQKEAAFQSTDVLQGHIGQDRQIVVNLKDRLNHDIVGRPVAFRSDDPAVATVSPTGLVHYLATGETRVIATSSEGLMDTTVILCNLAVKATVAPDTVVLGAEMISEDFYVSVGDEDPAIGTIQLAMENPAIASAPGYVLESSSFHLVGKQLGTTLLLSSGVNRRPDTSVVIVATPRIAVTLYTHGSDGQAMTSVGSDLEYSLNLLDSLGQQRSLSVAKPITIVSRNTGIMTLPQNADPYPMISGSSGLPTFPAHPVAPGSTWIVASGPGLRADSFPVQVMAGPKLRFEPDGPHTIGVTQMNQGYTAWISTTLGYDHGGDVPITFTNLHPQFADFPASINFISNAGALPITYKGLAVGADTIIATAPGFAPDTLPLFVTTPRFLPTTSLTVTAYQGAVGFSITDSTGKIHSPARNLQITATPANPAIGGPPVMTTMESPFTAWGVALRPAGVGVTTLNLSESGGAYPPQPIPLTVVLDSSMRVDPKDASGYGYGPPAPGQRFEGSFARVSAAFAFGVATPTVQLRAIDPSVLSVPATVPLGSEIPLIAGLTTGSTRIIGEAPGFRPDTSGLITVAPGHLELVSPTAGLVGGIGYQVTVRALSKLGHPLGQGATAAFALTSLDGGLSVPATVTVPTGGAEVTVPLLVTAPGIQRLAVRDLRAVPTPYAGDTVDVLVSQPRLTLDRFYGRSVAEGQVLAANIIRQGNVAAGPVTATIAHQTGRTTSAASVMLAPGSGQVSYPITGVKVGADTLVISAPGFAPDTVPIGVSEGWVSVSPLPLAFHAGDSVQVRLLTTDSSGIAHAVVEETTFAILTDGVVVSRGGNPIDRITIPAGELASQLFYVRLSGTQTMGTVRFYNLHYVERPWAVQVY